MPTLRGRVLLAVGVVFMLLASLASVQELYALALASFVLPLVSVVFVRIGRHRLGFVRSVEPERLFAGGAVRIRLSARNLARSSPPVLLEDPASAEIGGPVRLAVPPLRANGISSLSIERTASARGRFAIGPLRAIVVDPFGLAHVANEVAPANGVIVYPRIERLSERSPGEARGGTGRSILQRIAAEGDEFYAVREWQDGDDLRKIHWRSSARRGELMIKQEEIRPFPRATILLDDRSASHRGEGQGDSLEWGVSAAASIVWELGRQGFALRLATSEGGPGGTRWGREVTDPLLSTLALIARTGARTILPVLKRCAARPGAGGALFAIIPPPSRDLVLPLSRLRRAYAWCGAILLDTASFGGATGRERAVFDQRLADADRTLANAGWRVVVAGQSDTLRAIWPRLVAPEAFRPSSPSVRS